MTAGSRGLGNRLRSDAKGAGCVAHSNRQRVRMAGAVRSVCALRKNTGFAELNRNPALAPHIGSFTNGRYTWNTQNESSSKEKSDGLVAGGVGAHVAPGVDWGVVHADFVMDVRAGGAAADTGVADHFTALDARASNGGEGRVMGVPGGDAKSMVDHYQAAVAGVSFGIDNHAVGRRMHGRAVV